MRVRVRVRVTVRVRARANPDPNPNPNLDLEVRGLGVEVELVQLGDHAQRAVAHHRLPPLAALALDAGAQEDLGVEDDVHHLG